MHTSEVQDKKEALSGKLHLVPQSWKSQNHQLPTQMEEKSAGCPIEDQKASLQQQSMNQELLVQILLRDRTAWLPAHISNC